MLLPPLPLIAAIVRAFGAASGTVRRVARVCLGLLCAVLLAVVVVAALYGGPAYFVDMRSLMGPHG